MPKKFEIIPVHEEVSLDKFEFDVELDGYLYPCPCGDEFFISIDDLKDGFDIAECDSCSLKVKVLYDHKKFMENLVKKTAIDVQKTQKNDDKINKIIAVN